jgi:hypothetical protein
MYLTPINYLFCLQDELQEKQNCVNLQKILSHLEDIATKAAKPSDPRTLPTDTTLLQVFSAINDLKNMVTSQPLFFFTWRICY